MSANLDVAEAEHFSLLTITPTTGLVATLNVAHHFRHGVAVTGVAWTTATVDAGYGHDAAADEATFTVASRSRKRARGRAGRRGRR